MKELFELNLGRMNMDEYERKFLEIMRYVDFIKDEKDKIQIFKGSMIRIEEYQLFKSIVKIIRKVILSRGRKGNKTPFFINISQG
jgi:ribosomal protein L19